MINLRNFIPLSKGAVIVNPPTLYKETSEFPRVKLSSLGNAKNIYGITGLDSAMKGYPSSTAEPMSELLAPSGLKIYQKMRKNDPIVGGLILLLETVMKRLKWEIIGPNASLVKKMFDEMETPMAQIFGEISEAFCYGFYLGEKVWQVKNGIVTLVDIAPRSQLTIEAINDDDGMVLQNTDSKGQLTIPYAKCLHITFSTECRNPFGSSILRHLYKPYYYKVSIEAAEALGIERDLGGLPIMTAPEGFDFNSAIEGSPTYSEEIAQTLDWAISLVSQVRRDQQQGVVKPFGWDFTILRGEQRAAVPTSDIIARYNTEMTTGILANFISLGAFATTNNANTEIHVANFLAACESYVNIIAASIDKQIINPICRYNRIENQPHIALKLKNIGILKALGTFLSSVTEKGLIRPTESIKHTILELLDFPDDEPLIDPNTTEDKKPLEDNNA